MKAAVADCRALYARHSRRCGLELIDIRLPPKWLCGAFGSGVREHIPTHHRDPPDTPARGRSSSRQVSWLAGRGIRFHLPRTSRPQWLF